MKPTRNSIRREKSRRFETDSERQQRLKVYPDETHRSEISQILEKFIDKYTKGK